MNFLVRNSVDGGTADLETAPRKDERVDVYFSADVETDGPIPGPFSMLSFAMVKAGRFDGSRFLKPSTTDNVFYRELKPISSHYEYEALAINGLDRNRLISEGQEPEDAMSEAFDWIIGNSENGHPILVAYPASFDWTWLYWYFVRYCKRGSPFGYSGCFDIKTAISVKRNTPISSSGRSKLPTDLRSTLPHTHHAVDDATEQADIFSNLFK